MQSLWSNAADACVMSGKLALTVVAPATQNDAIGAHVSLPITTKRSGRARLTFKATGLPRGLSIGEYSGKITGTVKSPKGTFHPKITVSYFAGSATITFTWVVS
jgi:large repetitive protein